MSEHDPENQFHPHEYRKLDFIFHYSLIEIRACPTFLKLSIKRKQDEIDSLLDVHLSLVGPPYRGEGPYQELESLRINSYIITLNQSLVDTQ